MRTQSGIPVLLITCLLSACASTGTITPAGKDTYLITAKARGGMSWSDIKALALNDASGHCDQRQRHMLPIRISTSGVRGWTPQEASLTFRCVSDDDPDWNNPPPLEERRG